MKLYEITQKYYQDQDDCSDDNADQSITISSCNAGSGTYITIQTERWALDLDEIDKLADAMKNLIKELDGKVK